MENIEENLPAESEVAEQKDEQSNKVDLEVKQTSQENVSKVSEIKARLSAEIEKVEQNMTEINRVKLESIEKIELKKKELRELSGTAEVCKEKDETMREMRIRGKEIEDRKISITILDQTIANLDKQIAQIQSEHDKATAELDLKKRKLNEHLEYYDALNQRLTDLLQLLHNESSEHEQKLQDLLQQRSQMISRTDLSQTALKKMISQLDLQIAKLNKDHEGIMNEISKNLSDMEVSELPVVEEVGVVEAEGQAQAEGQEQAQAEGEAETQAQGEAEAQEAEAQPKSELEEEGSLLTEEQIKEVQLFEANLHRMLHPKMTNDERLALLRRGLQITPSGRIITKDDKIITLNDARILGLLDELTVDGEEEEQPEPDITSEKTEFKRTFYVSTPSESSSSEKSSSVESELETRDIEYLKRVFGKSLSLALSEITAVQPSDPIHYLAHWFIKYRYNQEIDEVKRLELQALIIEREKLEAIRWHQELEEEAYLAVLEALFRAENIIMQQDYERMQLMMQEMEGEYEEDAFNPLDFLTNAM